MSKRSERYERGALRPQGYNAFFDWAKDQGRAGLSQRRCPECKLFLFPQEPHPTQGCKHDTSAEWRGERSRARKTRREA